MYLDLAREKKHKQTDKKKPRNFQLNSFLQRIKWYRRSLKLKLNEIDSIVECFVGI